MTEPLLGPFEEMVLLALLRMDNHAYGMEVRRDLEARLDRTVTIGAVYSALERMEAKGWVGSRTVDGGADRGGRGRRYFAVRPEGAATLARSRELREAAWEGVTHDDILGTLS